MRITVKLEPPPPRSDRWVALDERPWQTILRALQDAHMIAEEVKWVDEFVERAVYRVHGSTGPLLLHEITVRRVFTGSPPAPHIARVHSWFLRGEVDDVA